MCTELIYKIQASKNSFLVQKTGGKLNLKSLKKLIQKNKKLSADGCIFIKKIFPKKIFWTFFNKDGSRAEMCANACCALSDLAYKKKWIVHKNFTIQILKSKLQVKIKNQKPFIFFNIPKSHKEIAFKNQKVFCVNTGVPHAVIPVLKNPYKNQKKLLHLAKALRKLKIFNKRGMNVSFFQINSRKQIHACSFERGVEDFTPACGTGAMAVAYYLFKKTKQKHFVIHMSGGKIEIQFKKKIEFFSHPSKIQKIKLKLL